MRKRPVIAIDGPSGVGKSTTAKEIAKRLGFALVDTGALYRTVALLADEAGVSWEAQDELARFASLHTFAFDSKGDLILDGAEVGDRIRTPRISMGASAVAKHKAVRQALLGIQRKLGEDGGIVLEGRDVGTVVFPDAEVKFFVTASAEVRARRRHLELLAKGKSVLFEEVQKDQEARDLADIGRAVAPLIQAEDAFLIECDHMSALEVADEMIRVIRRVTRLA
jgi:cytidylate kinase